MDKLFAISIKTCIVKYMTTDDLINLFELNISNSSELIKWEGDLGFSVLEHHGNGYASLYKFGIFPNPKNEDLKKLSITATYGKESDGGISLGTGENGVWDPVDLNFYDEFFYSENQKEFFHSSEKIQGKAILKYVEEKHKLTTRIWRGFFLRIKIGFWRKTLPNLIKVFDLILIKILWLISGEKTVGNPLNRYFSEKHDEKSNQKIKTDLNYPKFEYQDSEIIDFFGYKAKRGSVIFYCSFHLIIYCCLFYLQNGNYVLIKSIGRNSFLSICYIVVSFSITNSLIPLIIKRVISKTPKLFAEVSFKKLKV